VSRRLSGIGFADVAEPQRASRTRYELKKKDRGALDGVTKATYSADSDAEAKKMCAEYLNTSHPLTLQGFADAGGIELRRQGGKQIFPPTGLNS